MRRIIWTADDWQSLTRHFQAAGRVEAGAFLLFRKGRTSSGERFVVDRVLLPAPGALERQGPDVLRPSGQWLSAVMGSAIEAKCGLAFIHSHPHPYHPPMLSPIDWETSITWSKSICPAIDHSFASLVWSPKGVTGVTFSKENPAAPLELDRAESMGKGKVEYLQPPGEVNSSEAALDDRQVRALSEIGNRRLREMKVAVIGSGGTGSPLAEQLVRIGVAEVVIVDHDTLDDLSNVRRVVGSRRNDLGKSKAEVIGKHLASLELGTVVKIVQADLRTEIASRHVLDCDIAICTTDTQSSRAHLNQLAYQYYLPVIDLGVRIGTSRAGSISGMPVEIRTLLPDNGCLWCRTGALDSERIYEENLPDSERKKLAAEGYVQGLANHQPSVAPLNYVAAGMGLIAMLRLYSGQEIAHASLIVDAWEQFVHPLRVEINKKCVCSRWRGRGDDLPIVFLPGVTGKGRSS